MSDSTPGSFGQATLPADSFGQATLPADLTPPPPPDTAPKAGKSSRPTTRAGRAAAAAARKVEKADKAPKSSSSSKPRKASLETRIAGNLTTLGTVVAAGGAFAGPVVQADGLLIVQHAPNVAAALDKVAKDDPRVAAALERMLTVGTWSGLAAALLPLLLGIAANHGAIPASLAALLGGNPATTPDPAAAAGDMAAHLGQQVPVL